MPVKILMTVGTVLLSILLATGTVAKDSLPSKTTDGLVLMKHTKLRAVYMKPGAHLDEYDKVFLVDCYVAFKKNWQRERNDQTMDLDNRITDQDMKNIREHLAKAFNKVFTEVLSTKGDHEIVKTAGTGVLIVRPAIVNLEITAPDTLSSGFNMTFSSDAGQMTLFMELYDGKTGDIIARIIDPEAVGSDVVEMRDSVTNAADADRVLKRWATILNDHLAAVADASGG